MGIAKAQFNGILSNIFKAGNVIKLYSIVPNETTESGGVFVSGASYKNYTIKEGDFKVTSGEVTSTNDMMFYLCNESNGHGTAAGFGVFDNNSLLYFGSFPNPMNITYNTVPTIKKYNSSGEGIKITMSSTETSIT